MSKGKFDRDSDSDFICKVLEKFCSSYLGLDSKWNKWFEKNLGKFTKDILYVLIIVSFFSVLLGILFLLACLLGTIRMNFLPFLIACIFLAIPKIFGFACKIWAKYDTMCRFVDKMEKEEKVTIGREKENDTL